MKKYVVMLGVSITIMLGMMVAIPFLMAKASAEAEILAKAERDLKESRRIAAVKVNVESVVSDFMPKVVQRLDFPDRFYTSWGLVLPFCPTITPTKERKLFMRLMPTTSNPVSK